MANKLITETSPYLLQHAHNPVEWYPWGEESLSKAKKENKLILVSIGYSACHWCHVMEHESFEDEQVAEIMNQHFVCIKIDREERPDIDQVYMHAVQLMTGSGGWPLNCICLPDQRPIYGGTYFKTNDWKNLLLNLSDFWNKKPQEAIQYATKLTEGVRKSEQIQFIAEIKEYTEVDIKAIFDPWKRSFDMAEGGYNQAPKFPLPNNWQFMLRYAYLMKDDAAHVCTRLTLQKMAFGGIYDHIGGGFARYSVDEKWHIPHFEKMLYDNAQLVSLYAEAYQYTPDDLYKQIVYQTLDFIKREITSPEMGFYSALDADSEGVEGKFYTFTQAELTTILGDDVALFCIYYNSTEAGNWQEEHTNVFFRKDTDQELSEKLGISVDVLQEKMSHARSKILAYRSTRIRPALDYKILAAWNGMMLKAYTDAYRVFNEKEFLAIAIANAHFILQNLCGGDGLMRLYVKTQNFESTSSQKKLMKEGFLDDYAFVIDGLIGLYEATFNEYWLQQARQLCDGAIARFYDQRSGLFFYVSKFAEQLIANKQEIMDNVIPASNSVMAHNLFKLGHFFDHADYLAIASQQLRNVYPHIKHYGSAYSNWASLLLNQLFGLFEIAITGPEAEVKRHELEKYFIPNKILLGGTSGSLPLLRDKWSDSTTSLFVCKNNVCHLPCTEVDDAIKQIF